MVVIPVSATMSELNRAFIITFANKYSTLILDFLLVMLISRMLTPSELGIYSLAAGSVVIGQMLRDFGLGLYLIMEKDLTKEKIQGCFTISVLLCWILGLIYFLSANFLGEFFESKEVATLVKILSINFFLLPFCTLILSLLKRNMLFGRIMLIDFSSSTIRVISTVILLYASFGAQAIVIGAVIGTFTNVIFAIGFGEFRYYKVNFKYVKEITKFTSFVSFTSILSQLMVVIPEMIIGKFLDMDKVAYFNKGLSTISLFNTLLLSIIASVVQPYIAKINNASQDMSVSLYRIYNLILVIQWPFCIFLILYAQDFIYILYGEQWTEAVFLTQIFAGIHFFRGFIVMSDQLLNAIGEVKYIFRTTLLLCIMSITSIYLFVEQGIAVLAFVSGFYTLLKVIIVFPKVYRAFNLRFAIILPIFAKNFLIAALLLVVGLLGKEVTQSLPLLIRMGANTLILGSAWLFLVFITKHELTGTIRGIFESLTTKLR